MHSRTLNGSAVHRDPSTVAQPPHPPPRTPPGLYVLCATEFCERFGFALTFAGFVLYLTERDQRSEASATATYGLFLMLAHAAGCVGGMLADWRLGYRPAVGLGLGLMAAGYGAVAAVPSSLWCGLALLAIGSGLFKPNITVLVGSLYPDGDPRRDKAFGYFYAAVNLGSLLAPFFGEFLLFRAGWSALFGAAGGAMLIGILIFVCGLPWLRTAYGRYEAVCSSLLQGPSPTDQWRAGAAVLVSVSMALYWAAYFQCGGTLLFWARDNTAPLFMGHAIPPMWFSSFHSLAVLALSGSAMPRLWARLRIPASTSAVLSKMLVGLLLTGTAFIVMTLASLAGGDEGRVSPLWLIACYTLLSVGEMAIAPIGLSLVSALAPRRYISLAVGIWYAAVCAGMWLAGQLGALWANWAHGWYWTLISSLSLGSGLVLWRGIPGLRAAMARELPSSKLPRSSTFTGQSDAQAGTSAGLGG